MNHAVIETIAYVCCFWVFFWRRVYIAFALNDIPLPPLRGFCDALEDKYTFLVVFGTAHALATQISENPRNMAKS